MARRDRMIHLYDEVTGQRVSFMWYGMDHIPEIIKVPDDIPEHYKSIKKKLDPDGTRGLIEYERIGDQNGASILFYHLVGGNWDV